MELVRSGRAMDPVGCREMPTFQKTWCYPIEINRYIRMKRGQDGRMDFAVNDRFDLNRLHACCDRNFSNDWGLPRKSELFGKILRDQELPVFDAE